MTMPTPDFAGAAQLLSVPVLRQERLFDYLEESSLEGFLVGFPSVNREQVGSIFEQAANAILTATAACKSLLK